jgi:mannose-6-phosphate isomerase-like protein (cupin superfamily)
MTIEDAANKSDLTKSWWSKVENFRLTPSLPALFRVAAVLGVTISKLLEGLDARPPLVVVRPHERLKFERDSEISQVEYESLAHPRPNRRMDPMILSIAPGAERAFALAHEGEEFAFVLSGRIILEHGSKQVELSEGDAAYFDATTEHRMVNRFEQVAKILCVHDMAGVAVRKTR